MKIRIETDQKENVLHQKTLLDILFDFGSNKNRPKMSITHILNPEEQMVCSRVW